MEARLDGRAREPAPSLFGHEPLGTRTRSLFDAYARDSQEDGRYDFFTSRKLRRAHRRPAGTKRHDAYAQTLGPLHAFLAWRVWRTHYLFQMPQRPRRLRLILDWTIALFFKNDVVQLDLSREVRLKEQTAQQK